jgi:hypothetical protein
MYSNEARIRFRVSPCKVCDGRSGTVTGFSGSSTSVFLLSPFPPFTHLHLNTALSEGQAGEVSSSNSVGLQLSGSIRLRLHWDQNRHNTAN